MPDTTLPRNTLRDRTGICSAPAVENEGNLRLKATLRNLQAVRHSMQRIQSPDCRISSSNAVGQYFRQSPQSLQSLPGIRLNIEKRPRIPSNVPSGQIFRHQFLSSNLSMTKMNMIRANDIKARGYSVSRKGKIYARRKSWRNKTLSRLSPTIV